MQQTMSDIFKSKKELLQELDGMRRKLNELETCRLEFERVQRRYEQLLKAAPDAMIFINSNYEIVMVNAQAETLFGYSPRELQGKILDVLIPERFRGHHRKHVEAYFSNPRIRTMGSDLKIFGLKRDESEFRVDISLSPLRIDEDLLVTAAVRDITERIEAQEQIERNFHIQRVINTMLKMSLEPTALETLLDRTLDLILSVPHLSLSKGSLYLVEEEPPQLVMKTHRGMTDEQLNTCGRVPVGKCLCGKTASSCEMLFTDCVDERHEIVFSEDLSHGHYCVPIVSGGKPLGLMNVLVSEGHSRNQSEEEFLSAAANTLASVIERRRAEEDSQRLQGQLAQSEKMAALGRISSNIAHELRNPLTSIGGFARRLLAGLSEGDIEKEYAGFIVSEVINLEKTLKYVLEYSRITVPHLERQNIRNIIKEVLDIYDESCRQHNIRVKTAIEDVPDIMIDREQAEEAIGSLVSNAVDAMPSGGELTVSATVKTVDSRRYMAVKVNDSGEGMSPDIADKIFEPFFTTKIYKRGIGLGLPITKKIAEDHGGFISVSSLPSKGASFILYFPIDGNSRE
jgi:PAS domain S-box-containing protein